MESNTEDLFSDDLVGTLSRACDARIAKANPTQKWTQTGILMVSRNRRTPRILLKS